MSSYYTELDDALGADEEVRRDMEVLEERRQFKKRNFDASIARKVREELKKMGLSRELESAPGRQGQRGATVEVKCKCGNLFNARVADRKRGWGRYCSKSCKARFSK